MKNDKKEIMKDNLKIALIQSDLVWENPKQNRHNFSDKINTINQEVDLIILPEMFTTGFTMNATDVAETMQGETIKWMQELATKKQVAITGSVIISEDDKYYNRLLFVHPSGKIETYNKRHTFTLAREDKVYSAGTDKLIINYKGWKICPLICYDLRFPVWARNTEDYDVLLFVANWPKPRINAWNALLKARAIENMCYCIGVNRIGTDESRHQYSGHSAVYDGLGEKLSFSQEEETIYATISLEHISTIREKLKFLDDGDEFTLKS